VYFFGKKKTLLLLTVAVVLFAFLLVKMLQSGRDPMLDSFTPVNEQMQTLLTEAAEGKGQGMDDAAHTAVKNSDPSFSPRLTPSPTPGLSDGPASFESPKGTMKGRIELNSGTLEQFDSLPGIGESKAKAILAYRAQNGRFKRVEELLEVRGIGEKILERLKPFVYIADP
jgi:competence protein ComEA